MNTTTASEARIYTVVGMTCSHCASSVHDEVSELHGVRSVDVDLGSGRLLVAGPGFRDDAVQTAVEESGYSLAP